MSIIHIKQISNKLKKLFESHLDLEDIKPKDTERDIKVLSRCLAAYAVYNLIECTPEEAASSVVDGYDDNGIDAIFYSPNYKKMIIVQSKWSKNGKGEASSSDVGKFCKGVKDLFNSDFDRFNDKVNKKHKTIEAAINEFETKYIIVLIDTNEKLLLSDHSQQYVDDLLSEMNSTGDDSSEQILEFVRLNQSKVFSSFALSMGTSPINIEVGLENWGVINEPEKAYYGVVSATEIAQWWSSYERKLFSKNIRQVLGNTDVNEEIEETLSKSPENFWYYNNGITVIADKIEKSMLGGSNREIGSFKLGNVSIVNGAQTVSTIGKYSTKESSSLGNIKVQIRIISLSNAPDDFGKEVTRTNNRQNRIENRDFVSQDPEQTRIKTELAIEEIDYNIVRSDMFKTSENSFDLQEATVALACASKNFALAIQAKRGIGKFFEHLDRGIYKELFNSKVSGMFVYNCVIVDREINRILKEAIEKLPRKSGKRYGLLVHGNRIISSLVIKKLNLRNEMEIVDFKLDSTSLEKEVEAIIIEMARILNEQYSDNILGTLFKNISKCNDIMNRII